MLHYRSGVAGMGSGVGWQQSCMTWESMISLTKGFPGTLMLQSRRLCTSRLWTQQINAKRGLERVVEDWHYLQMRDSILCNAGSGAMFVRY
jgi:hypothetical protein